MSQKAYSCLSLLQATNAEKKEAWVQLSAYAKEVATKKANTEKVKLNFTLCMRCVEPSDDEVRAPAPQ